MTGPGAHIGMGAESEMKTPNTSGREGCRILGVDFYAGDVEGAIDQISSGGLLVVPAAPALKDLACNESYREAITNADVADGMVFPLRFRSRPLCSTLLVGG